MFCSARRKSWCLLGLVVAFEIFAIVLANAVLFQGAAGKFLLRLHLASGGLVEPTLVAGFVSLGLVVGVAIFSLGRLRPAEVGWVPSQLLPALIVLPICWVVVQLILTGLVLSAGGTLELNQAWSRPGAGFVLGGLLAQLLGNALAEETVFRGFFFPQLQKSFAGRLGPFWSLVLAVVVSQLLFALSHIPNRLLVHGLEVPQLLKDQKALLVMGMAFLAAYILTRNLWVVVGLHALVNDPASLVQVPEKVSKYVWHWMVLLVPVVWYLVRRLVLGRKKTGSGDQ